MFHSPINILGFEQNNVTSGNWSGYAVESPSQFTEVLGSWVEPTAKCTSLGKTYGAFWVGLDGYTSKSVEQLGTDSDCKNVNSPSYYAWYEMYPAASVNHSTTQFPVKPGDTMTASVTRSGTSYTLSLHEQRGLDVLDHPDRQRRQHLGRMGCRGAGHLCADLLQQRQTDELRIDHVLGRRSGHRLSLEPVSSFTTNSGPHDITMTTSSGATRAQPSALTSDGEGFTDTWAHN